MLISYEDATAVARFTVSVARLFSVPMSQQRTMNASDGYESPPPPALEMWHSPFHDCGEPSDISEDF